MNSEVLNEIINTKATVSIVVKDLTNNILLINYEGDKKVQSASIIKVIILLAVYKNISEGNCTLNDTVTIKSSNLVDFSTIKSEGLVEYTIKELIKWMIITSDNSATNELIDLLGFKYINDLCTELHLNSTILKRKMMDFEAISNGNDNYTCATDMLKLMELIYDKKFISEDVSNSIIEILLQQRDYDMLKKYICDNIKVAHKTGELNNINHDMGIFYLDNIDYYIGIFVSNCIDNEYGHNVIGKLSKIIYKYIKYEYMKE